MGRPWFVGCNYIAILATAGGLAMNITEEEALKKWCPMVRLIDSSNRGPTERHIRTTRCIGSGCMMWVWTNTWGFHSAGRCGLARDAEYLQMIDADKQKKPEALAKQDRDAAGAGTGPGTGFFYMVNLVVLGFVVLVGWLAR